MTERTSEGKLKNRRRIEEEGRKVEIQKVKDVFSLTLITPPWVAIWILTILVII